MFTATIEGASELATRWVNVTAAVRGGMRRGVSLGVTEGAAEARAFHRFKNRTGNLERSIQGRLVGSRSGASTRRGNIGGSFRPLQGTDLSGAQDATWGVIEAKAVYASWVEEGTKGGAVIVPKSPGVRWLRWFNPVGSSNAVFAKRVIRGATRPHPFMSFAYFKCERVMIREIERGVAQAQAILNR